MWNYDRNLCELRRDDVYVGQGYSGHGWGLNNPKAEAIRRIGPLPAGRYTIGPWQDHPHLGKLVAPLTPDLANQMFGRSDFWLHGDNPLMNHTASDGCVILSHDLRQTVHDSDDVALTVT